MTQEHDNRAGCEHHTELAALATAGALTAAEEADLERHLLVCPRCSIVDRQYRILARDGFAGLALTAAHPAADENWDTGRAYRKLLERVSELEKRPGRRERGARTPRRRITVVAAAACLTVAFTATLLRLGAAGESRARVLEASVRLQLANALAARKAIDEELTAEYDRLNHLQAENSNWERESGHLRDRLQATLQELDRERTLQAEQVNVLQAQQSSADEQVRALVVERDRLSSQLQSALVASQRTESQLTAQQADRGRLSQYQTELEGRVRELEAANRDQNRRLADSEKFLSSDRDIRELMGARNLYIADVFDVDSSSQTRKPFGRVFYTRGKSLIFYAFDLDRQPRLKTTSSFQVWGEKESVHAERAPTNLGILYLDSESNRRWVMRYDDPKTLSQIDAVFVTVEPHGGSAKPTGRPFLFAMLRKPANHP